MKSLLEKEVVMLQNASARLARLGAVHGYRFDGDTVHLNAMFTVLNAAAHQRAWALQLWACPTTPATATDIKGQLVAQAPLPPIGEVADDTESFGPSAPAQTPAVQGEHVMVLALVAGSAGKFNEVHDFAVYARTERFLQPRLAGNVAYRIEGGRIVIDVERIENPRDAANLSGSLALELWALAGRYQGGKFNGVPLAGVAFDALGGQMEYRQRSFELPFTPPPAGNWNLVLMLREWTAAGFVTRDFSNFAVPMVVASKAAVPVAQPVQIPAPVAAKPAPVVAQPAAVPPVIAAPAKAPVAVAKPVAKDAAVSVNSATKEELIAIKGLPEKVADGIVAKRPFKSLDEVQKVKGMGAKLLAKLRSKLKL
jgi:DNA uptake protein ComE-like DNA-binding protein